jgi:hypothetical protein
MSIDYNSRHNRGGEAGARVLGSFALVGLLLVLVSASAVASLPSGKEDGRPVAILFPPWTDGEQALSRSFEAGYRVIRTGRLKTVVVVDRASGAMALPKGAWLALTLRGLAGCLDSAADQAGRP